MLSVRYVIYRDNGDVLYSHEIKMDGGSAIVCRDEESIYPILSEITTVDIERFYPNEMDSLINELNELKRVLTKEFQLEYVEEIIGLCKKCRNKNEGQIVFDPFVDRIKFDTTKV